MATARDMHRRKLVAGSTGNVSARWRDGMLITPTRRQYSELHPSEIVWLLHGSFPEESARPSIEWRMHAQIYASRPDVGAILHTHSAFATARSFHEDPLVVLTDERTYLELPLIPVSQQQSPGSCSLARSVASALGAGRATLLARHGVVAVGATLPDALAMAETVEHLAQIDWLLWNDGRLRRGPTTPPALTAVGFGG